MVEARIGETVRVTLPWSEACAHMRVADREMSVMVLPNGAQLLNEDGSPFSFPITHGEAGIRVVPFNIGDAITTTVHMIGGRQAEVTGTVTDRNMSRKTPDKVLSYVVDATDAGYGLLVVEAGKARMN